MVLATGELLLRATVKDADGDSVSKTLDLGAGSVFVIEDDGPTMAEPSVIATADHLVLDESKVAPDGDGLRTVKAQYADNFFGATPVVNYGTDGAGSVSYALELKTANLASGLYALDATAANGKGAEILLTQAGNVITGSAGGVDYFTITVDATTGEVTFAQSKNIWHGVTTNPDDAATMVLATGELLLRATVKDADGDSVSKTLDLGAGSVFVIEDDGPGIIYPDTTVIQNAVNATSTVTLDVIDTTVSNNYGTDGAGTVRFPATLDGFSKLTYQLAPVVYKVSADGLTLTGVAGTTPVFEIKLNPAASTYSMTMYAKLDALMDVDYSSSGYHFSGGNDPWAGFTLAGESTTVPVNNDSSDLLLTPVAPGKTINSSDISGGIDNSFINPN